MPEKRLLNPRTLSWTLLLLATACSRPAADVYPDDRPSAPVRMDAADAGIVLPHGNGPDYCDINGARDVWVYAHQGTYYMNYDGAGPGAWLACLATSDDLIHWTERGPVLKVGSPGDPDSGSASYGTTYCDDANRWHLFYLGTPHAYAPNFIPSFPYLTLEATGGSPAGPWTKQPTVRPFEPTPGTFYATTASPGQIVRERDEYLMFFSGSSGQPIRRTIGIARTQNLDGRWTIDANPILPLDEQIENSSLYFEPSNQTWFLFTNHVGLDARLGEYTDAIWVYWSRHLDHWDPHHKAVVLDAKNCTWSQACIGLPSVIKVNDRLAIFYDAPGGQSVSHMGRDVGLAWMKLPLSTPAVADR